MASARARAREGMAQRGLAYRANWMEASLGSFRDSDSSGLRVHAGKDATIGEFETQFFSGTYGDYGEPAGTPCRFQADIGRTCDDMGMTEWLAGAVGGNGVFEPFQPDEYFYATDAVREDVPISTSPHPVRLREERGDDGSYIINAEVEPVILASFNVRGDRHEAPDIQTLSLEVQTGTATAQDPSDKKGFAKSVGRAMATGMFLVNCGEDGEGAPTPEECDAACREFMGFVQDYVQLHGADCADLGIKAGQPSGGGFPSLVIENEDAFTSFYKTAEDFQKGLGEYVRRRTNEALDAGSVQPGGVTDVLMALGGAELQEIDANGRHELVPSARIKVPAGPLRMGISYDVVDGGMEPYEAYSRKLLDKAKDLAERSGSTKALEGKPLMKSGALFEKLSGDTSRSIHVPGPGRMYMLPAGVPSTFAMREMMEPSHYYMGECTQDGLDAYYRSKIAAFTGEMRKNGAFPSSLDVDRTGRLYIKDPERLNSIPGRDEVRAYGAALNRYLEKHTVTATVTSKGGETLYSGDLGCSVAYLDLEGEEAGSKAKERLAYHEHGGHGVNSPVIDFPEEDPDDGPDDGPDGPDNKGAAPAGAMARLQRRLEREDADREEPAAKGPDFGKWT